MADDSSYFNCNFWIMSYWPEMEDAVQKVHPQIKHSWWVKGGYQQKLGVQSYSFGNSGSHAYLLIIHVLVTTSFDWEQICKTMLQKYFTWTQKKVRRYTLHLVLMPCSLSNQPISISLTKTCAWLAIIEIYPDTTPSRYLIWVNISVSGKCIQFERILESWAIP
jgi:hypothetical protein